jgi:hypothetical protein
VPEQPDSRRHAAARRKPGTSARWKSFTQTRSPRRACPEVRRRTPRWRSGTPPRRRLERAPAREDVTERPEDLVARIRLEGSMSRTRTVRTGGVSRAQSDARGPRFPRRPDPRRAIDRAGERAHRGGDPRRAANSSISREGGGRGRGGAPGRHRAELSDARVDRQRRPPTRRVDGTDQLEITSRSTDEMLSTSRASDNQSRFVSPSPPRARYFVRRGARRQEKSTGP